MSGVACLMIPILINGTRIITNAKFTPDSYVNLIKKYRVTNTFMTTPGARQMMKHLTLDRDGLSSVDDFLCGGEKLSRKVMEYLRSNLGENALMIVYGSTEMGRIASFFPTEHEKLRDFIAGYTFNNIEIKIVDIEDDSLVKDNQKFGEILIRSSALKFQVVFICKLQLCSQLILSVTFRDTLETIKVLRNIKQAMDGSKVAT